MIEASEATRGEGKRADEATEARGKAPRPRGNASRIIGLFYFVVLAVALTGAGQAATHWLGWPSPLAFLAVAAVELGGVALSAHADERRQLGERAIGARLLSALVAIGAVLTNFFGHAAELGPACFFAGMSALGYSVWLIQSGSRRRDELRRAGKLGDIAPVYGLAAWLRRPVLTARARSLALADPTLSKVGSLAAAQAEARREVRTSAIAKVLHRKIRASVDPTTADIAVAVYDLDEIAEQLRSGADYAGLTGLIAADLVPARLASPEARNATHATTEAKADVAPVASLAPVALAPTLAPLASAAHAAHIALASEAKAIGAKPAPKARATVAAQRRRATVTAKATPAPADELASRRGEHEADLEGIRALALDAGKVPGRADVKRALNAGSGRADAAIKSLRAEIDAGTFHLTATPLESAQ